MALDALDDMAAVTERYPDARADIEAALGKDLLAQIRAARETIRRAVDQLDDVSLDQP